MRRWNCRTFRGGFGKMEHVGRYSGCWNVGTLHTGSEEGIVFHLKSRIKMGEKSDVSILLFHFGTSSCIQVKEWEKRLFPTSKHTNDGVCSFSCPCFPSPVAVPPCWSRQNCQDWLNSRIIWLQHSCQV